MKILRLVLASCFIFVCSDLAAQIVITPNLPTYGVQTLAGATREINVQISNTSGGVTALPCGPTTSPSCTGTVNWSVTNIVGSETVTFTDPTHTAVSSINGALPIIQVNVGSVQGNCTASGSSGSYTVNSTVTFDVVATSTDDNTKTAIFPFQVCANSGTNFANGTLPVVITPAYTQAYQNQVTTLQSWVSGCVDETGVWSITNQPAGGNGTLTDTTYRDAVFSASVAGRYTVQYTANCSGGTNTAIIYVSPNALPSYASTPNQTTPHECYPDPQLTGGDYEVGSGFALSTISASPNWTTWPAGSIMRIHNTDTSGTNPSTFHEYMQIASTAGTASQPIIVCGVPDSLGNLPVIDGNLSTSQTDGSPNGVLGGTGTVLFWPGGNYGFWQYRSAGPNYASLWGLHVSHAKNTYTYYAFPPQQTFVVTSFSITGNVVTLNGTGPAYPINVPIVVSGLSVGTYLNGVTLITSSSTASTTTKVVASFTHANVGSTTDSGTLTPTTSTWTTGAACAYVAAGYYIDIAGNDMDTCGNGIATFENTSGHLWAGVTQNVSIHGNHIHGSGVVGDSLEHQVYLQSFYTLFEGNKLDGYTSGALGGDIKFRGVEGIFRYNYVATGATRVFDMVDNQDAPLYMTIVEYLSAGGPYASGDTAGLNVIQGYAESFQKDFVYGNMLFGGGGVKNEIHYMADHDDGVADRGGILYYYNNTMDSAAVVFDTDSNQASDPYFYPRVDARNNIFWTSLNHLAMNSLETIILSTTTNLYNNNGSMVITTPIIGGNYNAGTATGWQNGCDTDAGVPYCPWPLSNPINTHLYGLTSSNFLLTSTQPYNSTTMVPVSGSAAISAGTALTGVPAQLPVRFQYQYNTSSLAPRQNVLTIGAVDSGPPPVLQSITLSPLNATLQTGATQQYTALCNYSDGSQTTCTTTVTWSSTQPGFATISVVGLASGLSAGATTIMAVSSAISASTGLTVFVVPTSQWQGIQLRNVAIN